MASRKKFSSKASDDESTPGLCDTCHRKMPDEFSRDRPLPVPIHCTGGTATNAFRWKGIEHHGRSIVGNCWRCGMYLGCDQCTGPVTEVLCAGCQVWATLEAFVHHGPLTRSKWKLEDYPSRYQAAYRQVDRTEENSHMGKWHSGELAKKLAMPIMDTPEVNQRKNELHKQLNVIDAGLAGED